MALLGSPGTARRSTSFRPVLAVMEREISGIRPGQRETMRVVSTMTAGRYTRSSHDSVVRRRCRRAATTTLSPAAHRHVVLTIPRLLRPLFRRRRELLTELAGAGAEA